MGRATARSSAAIQNQRRESQGSCWGMWRCEAAGCRDGRAGEREREREELDLCPEEAGLAAGFPQGSGAAAAHGRKRMLGACQGQQLVGGKKREDSTVYPGALFKYVVRGGQTQESEQTG